MNELIEIFYHNYLGEHTARDSKEIYIINEAWGELNDALEKMNSILNSNLYYDIRSDIEFAVSDVQKKAFVAGFAQCAKLMSNGKIDFFPNDEEGGVD